MKRVTEEGGETVIGVKGKGDEGGIKEKHDRMRESEGKGSTTRGRQGKRGEAEEAAMCREEEKGIREGKETVIEVRGSEDVKTKERKGR